MEWSAEHEGPDAWHSEPDDGPDSEIGPAEEAEAAASMDSDSEPESESETEAWDDPPPEAEAEEPVRVADDADASRRRSKTIARKQMLRERRRMAAQGLLPEVVEYDRPQTRSQCREGDRPCLYVACRYHLYLDVNPNTGSIKINFPDREVWELEETCALDVAERGGITLEEVGDIMNLTRERIRQVEVSGLQKLRDGEVSLETFVDGRELKLSSQLEPPADD